MIINKYKICIKSQIQLDIYINQINEQKYEYLSVISLIATVNDYYSCPFKNITRVLHFW